MQIESIPQKCVHPWRKDWDDPPLPCGKCHVCKSKRASGWSFRLMKEAEHSSSAFFITLTYHPTKLPYTKSKKATLRKTDVQKFMKRLRKQNQQGIKYYLCGEYGHKTQRPHYHIILYNADIETVLSAWGLGDIHIGKVTPASVGYTLKYIQKARSERQAGDDRLREFSLMSKGLGKQYLSEAMIKWHLASVKDRMYCNLTDGKKIAMPRYYREKIYTATQKWIIFTHMEKMEAKRDVGKSVDKLNKELTQNRLILLNKIRLYGKDHKNESL